MLIVGPITNIRLCMSSDLLVRETLSNFVHKPGVVN